MEVKNANKKKEREKERKKERKKGKKREKKEKRKKERKEGRKKDRWQMMEKGCLCYSGRENNPTKGDQETEIKTENKQSRQLSIEKEDRKLK